MPTDTNLVSQRIRNIRKSRQLRVKDCAKVLGVSKETYRNYEDGSKIISIPELELLAFYLGVRPTTLIDKHQAFPPITNVLDKDIRPKYLNLRRKMVGAQIAAAREDLSASIDDLQQATQIPTDSLTAYEQGDTPIPHTDLFVISDYLEISRDALFVTVWAADANQENPWQADRWPQEESDADPEGEDDIFMVLLQALKQMSETDQAQIAKIILDKLRN